MSATEVSAVQPGGVTFAARVEGDAMVVCSGELDLATNPGLRQALEWALRLVPDRLVVDLSRVTFLDAGAIGEFVRAREASHDAGGAFSIRSPSAFGRRVLDIVGLADLIDAEPIEETAVSEATLALAGELTAGNRASVLIEEAKGLVAEYFDTGITEAAAMLRGHADARPQPLGELAAALVDGEVELQSLAEHAGRSSPNRP